MTRRSGNILNRRIFLTFFASEILKRRNEALRCFHFFLLAPSSVYTAGYFHSELPEMVSFNSVMKRA